MIDKSLGGYMNTYSGKRFYPLHPEKLEVTIEDIAHAESRNNRYGGHLEVENYVVAQHSCLVEVIATDIFVRVNPTVDSFSLYLFRMQSLLHDSPETLLQDMPKPIKETLPDYVSLEKKLQKHIFNVFKLPENIHSIIKEVDKMIRVAEVINFNHKWDFRDFYIDGKTDKDYEFYINMELTALPPNAAKEAFLKTYNEIQTDYYGFNKERCAKTSC